jgi:uncharacterized phage-associated protein
MATAHDVAAYILEKCGTLSAMKLQKLVYYCQAWSLVWDDRPMFEEPIKAWANGPVVPDLYKEHQGQFSVNTWSKGNSNALDLLAKETVDVVLASYGDKNAQYLSDLTHREKPWIDARKGLADGERGDRVITHEAMGDYYSSLAPTNGQ